MFLTHNPRAGTGRDVDSSPPDPRCGADSNKNHTLQNKYSSLTAREAKKNRRQMILQVEDNTSERGSPLVYPGAPRNTRRPIPKLPVSQNPISSVHENGVFDGHDAVLIFDGCSKPLRHSEQTAVGDPVVETKVSCDSFLDVCVRCCWFLPTVVLASKRERGSVGTGKWSHNGQRWRSCILTCIGL